MGDDEALIAAPLPNQHMARFRLEFRSHVRVAEPDAPKFSTYAWPVGINLAADATVQWEQITPRGFCNSSITGILQQEVQEPQDLAGGSITRS